MTDSATQQPSPTKRGRGRGRGGATRGAASTRARGKAATGRRGRAKIYEASRAQAAHERQRDLKNSYSALAAAMKPALEELADRNLDLLKSNFDAHKEVDQYNEITDFLDQRFDDTATNYKNTRDMSLAFTRHEWNATQEYTNQSFQVCMHASSSFNDQSSPAKSRAHTNPATYCQNQLADKLEEHYDTLLRRLDILDHLRTNGLPVNVSSHTIPLSLPPPFPHF